MVLPTQFQLGLELTNIVNPISQAMSALGSLAVIDAIKKSGSDFITETKLANLIGRHRIDPVIKFHFREMVAKSDQSMLSKYMDIILESGSGPTVQEALKNPALFSMVIQLSGLAFAHENESLANTLVEAIEKIAQESKSDMSIVPDYLSLLGTLRACQQQTAGFRWAWLYEATEEKIRKVLADPDNQTSRNGEGTYPATAFRLPETYEYEQCRALPIAVLQGLLMWLQSLQSFPEHRLLHVICNTGLSTVVVWCHHVLGLSLTVNIREMEICFGDGPHNLLVVHSPNQNAGVSLMDPLDIHEPLFTLQCDQHSTGMAYDHRAEACGYGTKFLQYAKVPEQEQAMLAQFVKSRTVEVCEHLGTSDMVSDAGLESTIVIGPRYPSRSRLLSACRFLFPSDESATMPRPEPSSDLHFSKLPIVQALIAVVITFARVSEGDLTRCAEMPLALNVLTSIRNKKMFTHVGNEGYFDLLESFELLSLLLLGHHWYNDYDKPTVLFSAWGWSTFLDSIDDIDPFDVSINTLRVMRGVPSRQGIRRNRIIDGPTRAVAPEMWRSLRSDALILALAAGIGTAEKGIILVGHHTDAFQVTQQFTCRDKPHLPYRYGFRAMAEWSIRSRRFPPCQCINSQGEQPSGTKLEAIDKILKEEEGLIQCSHPTQGLVWPLELERVFSSKDCKNLFTYVSDNPAARWLQLATMYGENEGDSNNWPVVLAGRDTCVACAIRNGERLSSHIVFL